MKKTIISLMACLLFVSFSNAADPSSDRSKVEFFEKLYKTKIVGVKLLEEYPDPDQFYSAIAKQVGIPEVTYKAVEEKYGWKNDEKNFLALMIKGGGSSDDWGVMVTKFPIGLKNAKSKEEAKKLLKDMEMKMVVIGYDGKISFPEKKKRKTAPTRD
jgi:hypothetical protein